MLAREIVLSKWTMDSRTCASTFRRQSFRRSPKADVDRRRSWARWIRWRWPSSIFAASRTCWMRTKTPQPAHRRVHITRKILSTCSRFRVLRHRSRRHLPTRPKPPAAWATHQTSPKAIRLTSSKSLSTPTSNNRHHQCRRITQTSPSTTISRSIHPPQRLTDPWCSTTTRHRVARTRTFSMQSLCGSKTTTRVHSIQQGNYFPSSFLCYTCENRLPTWHRRSEIHFYAYANNSPSLFIECPAQKKEIFMKRKPFAIYFSLFLAFVKNVVFC